MKNQLESAKNNIATPQIQEVAQYENMSTNEVIELMVNRKLVIPVNNQNRQVTTKGIGQNTRVKVNVNLGTSRDQADLHDELKKADIAKEFGADTIMDLSTGNQIHDIRKQILQHTSLPLGTVPAYEAFEFANRNRGSLMGLKAKDLFSFIETQAKDGVDFMTLHCGITKHSLARLEKHKRILGIVSRGGALMARWMKENRQENPLFEYYDEVLDIAAEYDITISLGDALRPGCIEDGSDRGQIEELILLGELADRAFQKNVQVIVEGPGHLPLNQIGANMEFQKKICQEAPFYVLGPIVCDIAPGYDHITAAIGGSLAAYHGADFLCYVTPAEHLRLPNLEDVKDGIIASKIAAFSADLARGKKYAKEINKRMVLARKELNWNDMFECSIDPQKAKQYHSSIKQSTTKDTCSMCSDMCAIKLSIS